LGTSGHTVGAGARVALTVILLEVELTEMRVEQYSKREQQTRDQHMLVQSNLNLVNTVYVLQGVVDALMVGQLAQLHGRENPIIIKDDDEMVVSVEVFSGEYKSVEVEEDGSDVFKFKYQCMLCLCMCSLFYIHTNLLLSHRYKLGSQHSSSLSVHTSVVH
jgi:hypothetical protein